MQDDISQLPLDDQFMILLHKKIMDKTGSAKRRAKKYYMDQYKKTGVIPKPLLIAGQGSGYYGGTQVQWKAARSPVGR